MDDSGQIFAGENSPVLSKADIEHLLNDVVGQQEERFGDCQA
jgi:hypothetical protein